MKIERWLVLSDLQVPYHDLRSLSAVEKYMTAHKWDGYLNIGDFLDFDCISSFNKNAPRRKEGKRIWRDIHIANEILDRHQKLVKARNPKAKFVLLEGNHEERLERWLDENPEFDGYLSVPRLLRLEERGVEWIKSWSRGETYKIGKATFLHGNYTNQYHPSKMATKYGDSVFYGHTHDMMCHAVSNHLNANKVHVGQSIGCLCEREQAYMKGKPSNWQQGFMVLYLYPDGNFTYYTPRVFSHKFIGPDGISYEG